MAQVKSQKAIALMRQAGAIVAAALREMAAMVAPGVTTLALDERAETVIRDMGAVPSFKGYHGFPGSICASVNEEIVHGIPGSRRLQEGDIISLDVGTIYEGYQGDAAITVAVGEVPEDTLRLMAATQAALDACIAAARHGARLGDVSHAVERVAEERGFAVVREYGGHAIGAEMHESPNVPNWGPPGRGMRLVEGMTFALEPMLMMQESGTRVLNDDWTVVTASGVLSAHYEHTIVVRQDGGEILTTQHG
jgi:methionyl aminopeptidase